MSNTKYALYKYSTENIGDEIQSIAARRFLPRVDYYIDRDRVGEWKNPNQDEEVKLITNGWYMRKPFAWPITDPTINPLLISMYVEQKVVDNKASAGSVFLTKKSRDYIKKFGPIGARDMCTLEFFRENGVDAYFSGCVTLTLQRDASIKKQDFILAVDVSDKMLKYLRSHTKRRVIAMSPYRDFDLDDRDRMIIAEYFLYLYQAAHAVVTTRLHATLPCLALETPVLLVKQTGRYDPKRYAGLGELARNVTEREYFNNHEIFDLDEPGANPTDYLTLRKSLVERCSNFTGFDNKKTWRTIDMKKIFANESFIATFSSDFSGMSQKYLQQLSIEWLRKELSRSQQDYSRQLAKLNDIINDQKAEIASYKNELEKIFNSRTHKIVRIVMGGGILRRLINGRKNK